MAGRLDDDKKFAQEAKNNMDERLPLKNDDDKSYEKTFDGKKAVIALSLSKKHELKCLICKSKTYRMCVVNKVPTGKLAKNNKKYVQAIDLNNVEKINYRLDSIVKVVLKDEKADIKQEAVRFKK